MFEPLFFLLGSIFGGVAVILGAFGSHVLKNNLSAEQAASFETGVRYQMYHALALIIISYGIHLDRGASMLASPMLLPAAGMLFVLGTLLFSGSIYMIVATGMRQLGIITPFGGIALIAGWLCLALAAI